MTNMEDSDSEVQRLRKRLVWIRKDINQADSMEKFLWLAVELAVELQNDYSIRQHEPVHEAFVTILSSVIGSVYFMSREHTFGNWDSELPEAKEGALFMLDEAQEIFDDNYD